MSIFEKVKELRDITGAGMQDCKVALSENNEDIDLAIEYLRKKGIAKAAKKSDRGATEGLITLCSAGSKSAIIEINSETDFVAKNPEFNSFCEKISELCIDSKDINDLNEKKFDDNETASSALVNLIAKIGENIKIRRFENIDLGCDVASYIHNKQSDHSGKLGVLLAYESTYDKAEKSSVRFVVPSSELAKDFANKLCMHIAASSPLSLNEAGISQAFLESEKNIMKEQLLNEGKKPEMIEKIIAGKVSKIIKDNTLLGQKWVMNPETTVYAAIREFEQETNSSFVVKHFVRYKVGEGIESKKADFAEEVKSLTK